MPDQTPPADKPAEKAPEPKGITLVHEGGARAAGVLLSIGKKKYVVEDGYVTVAAEDVEAAQQAGFR